MKSQAELDAMVAGLRDAHRELRAPLSNRGILRVLARERIPRRAATLPVAAMTVIQYGRAAIIVDPSRLRNPREETAVLAEEYAHARLHVGELDEVVLHLSSCATDDPREYEADYVARCLLAGPGVDVAYVTPKPAAPRRTPAPAPDPYTWAVPHARPRRAPRYGSALHETALQAALRRARPKLPRPMRDGPPSDHGIIEHTANGRLYFTDDQDGIRWEVRDVAFFDAVDGRRREIVKPGNLAAQFRYFLNRYSGEQRVYRFARWELRDVAVRHMERQFRESTVILTAVDAWQQRKA